MSKVIVIIGAGNGIGKAVAERFGKEGFAVALIARKKGKLHELQHELKQKNIDAYTFIGDAGDTESMRDVFSQIWEKWDFIEVLHYNVANLKNVDIANETADGLTKDFKVNVAGVMTALHHVLPDMEKKKKGTILLTGGGYSLQPNPQYGSLSIGKAGIRNLAQSLHIALQPKNIFVGTVTICGKVDEMDEKYTPIKIAEQFWKLYIEKSESEIQY